MSSFSLNPKIEAIYTAIEEENFDKAIKLCLKKSEISNQPITLALLSYCYVQKRSLKEAMEIARLVMRHVPTDEHVLDTLSHTYRACKAEDELAICYENAITKDPSKDGLLVNLFFIYNRLCDAKKMQLIAQKLYKMKSLPRFLFWSVSSMLLQNDLPSQMLTVAERMIEKVFNENYKDIQPGAEEFEMYIHLICKQGRFADALTAFDKLSSRSPGSLINDDEEFQVNASKVKMHNLQLMTLRLNLLEKLSLKDDAIAELVKIIDFYPDQWIAHQKTIDYLFDTTSQKHDLYGLVLNHQKKLHSIQSNHGQLRGPFLAEIFLLSKWILLGKTDLPPSWIPCNGPKDLNMDQIDSDNSIVLKEFCSLICAYVDKFQSKQCCFSDVQQYVVVLDRIHSVQALLSIDEWTRVRGSSLKCDLEILVKSNTNTVDERRDQAVYLLCCISKMNQLSFFCQFLSSNSNPLFATKIIEKQTNEVDLYQGSKSLCVGGVGGEREVQPGDELLQYCSSAHRVLYSSSYRNIAERYIEKIISSINWIQPLLYGIETSPHNHALKLDLLEPYRELAIGEASVVTFSLLRPKHVQYDSMSYLILPALVESGFFKEAIRQNRIVCSFHRSCKREVFDNISNSFRFCNYMKVLELKRFIHRCQKSTQLAISKTELPLLELMEKPRLKDAIPFLQECLTNSDYPFFDESSVNFDEFIDNMDYSIVTRYDTKLEDETIASEKRRHQYLNRIKESYLTTKMLYQILSGDSNAQDSLEKVMIHIGFESLERKASSSDNEYFQWNQDINVGGNKAKYLIWKVIRELAEFCTKCNKTKDAILSEEMSTVKVDGKLATSTSNLLSDLQSSLSGVSEEILKSINEVHVLLLGDNKIDNKHNVRYLTIPEQTVPNDVLPPLDPKWIKQLTFFTRTLGCWGPLFMQKAIISFPNTNKKDKKDKKKKKSTEEEIHDTIKSISHSLLKLMDDIQKSLSKEVDDDNRSIDKLLIFTNSWDSDHNKFSDDHIIGELRKSILEQLVSSQKITCSNVTEILRNGIDQLRA